MAEGLVRRTQYWNLPTHTVRTGPTGHAESLVDLEEYLLPMADARTAALHLWGVAEGLEVSAVVGSGELTVTAGLAVDGAGRTIALTAGGVAVTDPAVDPVAVLDVDTVPVGPAGVTVATAEAATSCLLTVTWREVQRESAIANVPVLLHAPWLRLVPAAGFVDRGEQVVLAKLTLDAAGLVADLVPGPRRLAGSRVGRLELTAVSSAPKVGQAVAATLSAEPNGDVLLQLLGGAQPLPALRISAGSGDAHLAGALNVPSLTVDGLAVAAESTEGVGLDVLRRMRVRSNGAFSAGVWFHQDADRGFVGMLDDTHLGFYGANGAGWGLVMDTANANVGIGIGAGAPAARLHVDGFTAIRAAGWVRPRPGPGPGPGPVHPFPLLRGVGVDTSGDIGIRAAGRLWAGQFDGDVVINGALSKAGGGFTIDHPLDPGGRYLSHSFVESPEMLNLYAGTVVTDGGGHAWIELPAYFEVLNRDVTYQLTPTGQFRPHVTVSGQVSGNRLEIRTEPGGLTVHWLVTGVRQDPWADEHRIVAETPKPEPEVDRFLHPELYGAPPGRGLLDRQVASSNESME